MVIYLLERGGACAKILPMSLLRTVLAALMAVLATGVALAAAETNVVEDAAETVSETAEPAPAASSRSKIMTVPPFSRYEIIISRKPFGTPPPVVAKPAAVDPTAAKQAQEEQKLARQINMVAVNKTPSGKTAVGFIDKSSKPERNYYINVGETVNGFTVVEASYEDETATLSKDDITITLKLGQGLVKSDTPAAPTPPAGGRPTVTAVRTPTPRVTATARTPPPRPAPPVAQRSLNTESFRERLARQRAEREAAEAARQKRAQLDAEARAEKISKEELEKAKREINLNLIRQGMKPISPITLTPEEDAEMVRLGVLESQ